MSGYLLFPIILILACSLSRPVSALELFGVNLESARLDELRAAIKQGGLVVLREAGEEEWFDVYDSSTVLVGSSRLYLGFVQQDQRVAFLEYEFNGLKPHSLLNQLNAKYGEAEVESGRFISDRHYRWQRDGIEIQLLSDWHRYKTRLIYTEPANLAALRNERAPPAAADEAEASTISLY